MRSGTRFRLFCFETICHSVDQLVWNSFWRLGWNQSIEILLPQPSEGKNYRCEAPCLAFIFFQFSWLYTKSRTAREHATSARNTSEDPPCCFPQGLHQFSHNSGVYVAWHPYLSIKTCFVVVVAHKYRALHSVMCVYPITHAAKHLLWTYWPFVHPVTWIWKFGANLGCFPVYDFCYNIEKKW